jgi:hypothetical protein
MARRALNNQERWFSARAEEELRVLGFNWSDDIVIVSLYTENPYWLLYYSSSPRPRQGGRADDQRARGPAAGASICEHFVGENMHLSTMALTF